MGAYEMVRKSLDNESIEFRYLNIGDTFDWIDPTTRYNSFFKRCEKVSTRCYRSESGARHTVGTIKVNVFHVERKM